MNFWDRTAGIYDLSESLNGRVYREMCAITKRLVPFGARVLDCAAGTGELSLAAAEKADSVLCTDLSENMLKTARKKAAARRCKAVPKGAAWTPRKQGTAQSRGADNISFDIRNIFDLRDPDNTYDVVIAGNVLHLLSNPQGAVKELYRVLKPGGRLLLPTFTTKNHGKALLSLYRLLGYDPAESYSPSRYKKMLEECGIGRVRTKLITGLIPCCYAVIIKN